MKFLPLSLSPHLLNLYLSIEKLKQTDMGEPFGKASWQTFRPMSTHASNPYWNSPLVTSDCFP